MMTVTKEAPATANPAKVGRSQIELASQFAALPEDALATTQQAAAFLSRSIPAMERDRQHGEGVPFVRIGRSIRYQKSIVLAYVQQNLRWSTSQGGAA